MWNTTAIIGVLAQAVTTGGGGTPVAEYTVTVAAGKVAEDLTDFPLMIDLSLMPSSFWENVSDEGGNIRVYAADGTTLIPFDVTYVNKALQIGRLFAKTTLLTASDNNVVVKLLSSELSKLPVTDPNGRNAVWDDYDVVWVFPETANRTGKAYTQSMGTITPHSTWVRVGYANLTGSPHNGICTDGTHFISTDDVALRRMNMSYVVQQTVANINTQLNPLGILNIEHMGDPVCVGTSTFFTVTDTTSPYRRWLVEYNTADLTLLNAWEMTGAQREFGATVCYDGTHLLIFSFTDGTKFIKYTTDGAFVGEVPLDTTTVGIQGSTVMPGGNIYISYDPDVVKEITPTGEDVRIVYNDPHSNIMEGLENRDGTLWLLKGNGALVVLREDTDYADYVKVHYTECYADLPTFNTFSMGTSIFWTTTNRQQGFVSVYNLASSAGARVAYDEGPDRLDAFATTDSWIVPPVNDNPPAYSYRRLGLKHNGTTERKLHINGAVSDTDATIVANPGGTGNARFMLNASRVDFEDGEAYYQFAWLRLDYRSDAWMAADAANMNSPGTFYTLGPV